MKQRLVVNLVPFCLAGCELACVSGLLGQVADPTKPDRGIAPLVSYAVSQFETIDPGSGSLLYQFPIAGLTPGRGGFTAGLSLTYNSTIYDVQPTSEQWVGWGQAQIVSRLVGSASGGGWRYSFQYGLLEESIPFKACPCTTRLSVVFPDGSRHVLQLYNNGVPNDADGGSAYEPNGQPSCPGWYNPITSGLLTYYTTDGTFIKVVIAAAPSESWTSQLWTMYMPDGSKITGVGSWTQAILDRNSNDIWFNNFYQYLNQGQVQMLIGDSFGRVINLQRWSDQDVIHQTGYLGTSAATWIVTWGTSLVSSSNQYRCTADGDLCSGSYPIGQGPEGWPLATPVVQSISVNSPGNDTVTYSFSYDSASFDGSSNLGWGEMNQVTPPSKAGETPATVTYTYGFSGQQKGYDVLLYNPVSRKEVDWQEEYDGQATAGTPDVWTYVYGAASSVITAPDGGQTQYYFPVTGPHNLANRIVYPDLSEVDRTWYQNYPLMNAGGNAPVNPYVQTETRMVGGAPNAAKIYSVDKNGNQTSLTENWGGLSIRSTASDFNGCHSPAGWCTADGGNALWPADDPNAYWNSASPQFRDLLTRRVVTASLGPGAVDEYQHSTTGDLTEERHWNSALGLTQPLTRANAVVVDRTYNSSNLTQVVDGRSIETDYVYDGNNLYPTQMSIGGVVQNRYYFDLTSGLLVSKWDGNNVQNAYNYDDLNRPLSVSEASNASPSRNTTTSYEDGNRRTIVTDGAGRVTITEYDQLRRVALNRRLENPSTQSVDDSSAGIKVQTRYKNSPMPACGEGVGGYRYRLVSNPYRASTSAGASSESTMGWTLTTLDNMGRAVRTESFIGSALPCPWGSNSNSTGATVYGYGGSGSGYDITVTDQAGATRVTSTDGLGRLTRTVEVGIAGGNSAYTYYSYDGMDNLIGVNQSGQMRSYTYDSLNRLTQAVSGESGTTCYTYDNDGNLQTRLQAANSFCTAGILTSYYYDNLNRMTSKVMPEGTVTYTYDQGAYGVGRLYSVSFGSASTIYGAHDALGRVTAHTQSVEGVPYNFSYTYNATDDLSSETYPSGRQVTFTYDTAVRVSGISSGATAYASSVLYGAQGAVASFQIGNGLWETTNYNGRLQAQQISLGSCSQNGGPGIPACSQDQWWLQNTYSTPGTQNNGNLLQQIIGLPGVQISEAYSYDKANRLLVASEQSSNPGNPPCPDNGARYVEGFQYDVWGNRTVPCLTGLGPSTLTPWSFDWATNRISPGTGWLYETTGRGNIIQEPSTGTYRMYAYDSENRQVAFCTQDPGGCVNADGPGRTRYVYDGDGRRVEKRDSTGITTYLYDVPGNLAAEYTTEVGSAVSGTRYLTADQLGTTRVVTAGTPGASTVVARRDYRPFGEEIVPSGGDPRVGVVGYQTDPGTTMRFTGKERDAETGLDFFGARYASAAQGRFTSPDPSRLSAFFDNPQTWNMYTYAYNNPLQFVDKNGRWPTSIHNKIIEQAFKGTLTPDQIQIVKDISAQQDSILGGGQANALSFQHAMRAPGQSVAEAEADYQDFVSMNEDAATKSQVSFWIAGNPGFSNDALEKFAAALHAILDSTSPAHAGFQVWDWRNPALVWRHHWAENTINQQQLNTAVTAAQNAFNSTFFPSFGDPFDFLQLQFQQQTPPTPTVTSKICYTLDDGTQVCQ